MIQIYTGNGKGKTTAALGLAIRAAGGGFNVYIAQFAKGRSYSELAALKKFKNIKTEQFGRRCFIRVKPDKKDIELACEGLKKAKEAILSKKYRIIILDEINIALKLKLVSLQEILGMLRLASKDKEVVLTGRYAHPQVIKIADLVSEIKEVKHYYKKGVKARKGIEF
ncbi:MAG: cob(I)yrinic acid a,c-diamide adenosyltransferase [Candidatus Omnitrophica bacterium]|nr:cob(I)yrinic acid a,c-diamide adenosyltransferase [Candidatus Omnitrophota bacterium]